MWCWKMKIVSRFWVFAWSSILQYWYVIVEHLCSKISLHSVSFGSVNFMWVKIVLAFISWQISKYLWLVVFKKCLYIINVIRKKEFSIHCKSKLFQSFPRWEGSYNCNRSELREASKPLAFITIGEDNIQFCIPSQYLPHCCGRA